MTCVLHHFHYPRPLDLDAHHIVPKSWVGGPGAKGETILVCPTGHRNIHVNMDALIAGKNPPSRKNSAELKWATEGLMRAKVVGAIVERTL